ncbi:N-acetyltransferase complex ARD1 subunit [Trypanosoma cruzi cruzi]|nr:N-acetyltransferase complex ARD1 subunit [Trypanosoma cruzi cruzi]
MHCAAGFSSLCLCPFVSVGGCGWLSTCPEHWGPPHTHGAHLGSLSQHPCLVTGREGRVACFLLPRTYQLLRSWSEAKGNKRVCLRLIAGGRAEVVFLLLICCHCACGDVNGGLFSRGIHCAICACPVSNVFSAAKWVLRRIGIHGCARASCRSPVITHTHTVSVSLIRHVLQNGRNHLWDIT